MRRSLSRPHPILLANAILASPVFILGLNISFALAVRFHIGIDLTDLGMSWATMFMDQVIIAAGWILSVRTLKWQREVSKQLREIRKLAGLSS